MRPISRLCAHLCAYHLTFVIPFLHQTIRLSPRYSLRAFARSLHFPFRWSRRRILRTSLPLSLFCPSHSPPTPSSTFLSPIPVANRLPSRHRQEPDDGRLANQRPIPHDPQSIHERLQPRRSQNSLGEDKKLLHRFLAMFFTRVPHERGSSVCV